MSWWIIKTPYDYHKQAEVLVKAKDEIQAMERLLATYDLPSYLKEAATLTGITRLDSDIYVNYGCDC